MTDPDGPFELLTLTDLLDIAEGVIDTVQVRDIGLLASASARPSASAFGDDAYPSFAEKAAAFLHSVARNHALVDGNKRIAWATVRVFCLLNGRDLSFTVDEAETMILAAAAGTVDVPELAALLREHLHDPLGA